MHTVLPKASRVDGRANIPYWKRVLAYLSLYRHERQRDMGMVIAIAALMGACYGGFVRPYWSEAVQFAQAWAGQVDCRANAWCEVMFATPSLQITLPALLLRLGVGVWPLSLFVSALFSAIAFMGVAAAGFVFTRHVGLALVGAVLLLTYQFGNPYGYPVTFPLAYYQFGQTGLYLCVLALALLAAGHARVAAVLGGVLCAVHAVWGLGFVLGGCSVTYLLRRKLLGRVLVYFLCAAIGAMALQQVLVSPLPVPPAYTAPVVPARAEGAVASPAANGHFVRPVNAGHNVLLTAAPNPRIAILAFALPTLAWLVLAVVYVYTARRVGILLWRSAAAKHLLLMAGMVTLFASGFKLMEELDPDFTLLALLDPHLPMLAIRAILSRLFALSGVMVPLIYLGILSLLLREGRSWLALGALGATFWLALSSWAVVPPSEALDPAAIRLALPHYYGLFLAVVFGVGVLWLESAVPLFSHDEKLRVAIFGLMLLVFFAYHGFYQVGRAQRLQLYRGSDRMDGMVRKMRQDKGQLILGAQVVSERGGFNPQLRTGRPIIPPMVLSVYDAPANKAVHVFCAADYNLPAYQFRARVKPCFEGRSAHEWRLIARVLPASGVLVPQDYTLQLPLVAKAGGFKYYRLPKGGA